MTACATTPAFSSSATASASNPSSRSNACVWSPGSDGDDGRPGPGPREPGRRRRLGDAVDVDERFARDKVRVPWRLGQRKHRCRTASRRIEDLFPLVAGLFGEAVRPTSPVCRPRGRLVVVMGHADAEAIAEFCVELRLHRADRDVAPVGGGIHAVKVGGTVEQIVLATVAPRAGRNHPEIWRQQGCHAVDHRNVEDLALTRLAGFEDRAEHSDREQHSAAAVVADQIQRRHRGFGRADAVQGAGQRDVVDVMTGCPAKGPSCP